MAEIESYLAEETTDFFFFFFPSPLPLETPVPTALS